MLIKGYLIFLMLSKAVYSGNNEQCWLTQGSNKIVFMILTCFFPIVDGRDSNSPHAFFNLCYLTWFDICHNDQPSSMYLPNLKLSPLFSCKQSLQQVFVTIYQSNLEGKLNSHHQRIPKSSKKDTIKYSI